MNVSGLQHAGPLAINMNQPGSFLHWSIFTVSVANLVLIAVMVIIFGAALLLPSRGESVWGPPQPPGMPRTAARPRQAPRPGMTARPRRARREGMTAPRAGGRPGCGAAR